jgi:hypothetical protein
MAPGAVCNGEEAERETAVVDALLLDIEDRVHARRRGVDELGVLPDEEMGPASQLVFG